MVTIIKEPNILEDVNHSILQTAISEGFVNDDTVAFDATHFEAKDQAPPKEAKRKTEPKKRGRKSKAEREQWLIEQAERQDNLPLFEKKIEKQLSISLEQLRAGNPSKSRMGCQEKQRR